MDGLLQDADVCVLIWLFWRKSLVVLTNKTVGLPPSSNRRLLKMTEQYIVRCSTAIIHTINIILDARRLQLYNGT